MTAEEVATRDIIDDLRMHSRCFIAFRQKLNPIMEELVDNYPTTDDSNGIRFKVGDTIEPIVPHRGVEEATVMRIDDKNYYLKILCGTAILPISAQECYKLKTRK